MGRFTPVNISILPASRNERLILEGVPPNISVRIIMPSLLSIVLIASEIASLMHLALSQLSMDTYLTFSSLPTMASAVATRISASLPCVIINAPTIKSLRSIEKCKIQILNWEAKVFLIFSFCNFHFATCNKPLLLINIPVPFFNYTLVRNYFIGNEVNHRNRPVPAAGATDGNCKIGLALLPVVRYQKTEEVDKPLDKLLCFWLIQDKFPDPAIPSIKLFKFFHEIRIGQKSYIHDKVCI